MPDTLHHLESLIAPHLQGESAKTVTPSSSGDGMGRSFSGNSRLALHFTQVTRIPRSKERATCVALAGSVDRSQGHEPTRTVSVGAGWGLAPLGSLSGPRASNTSAGP